MPFTVSHALAVLPLATGRPGRRLVPAALVIGSMVPDLPYFVPPHRGWQWTHAASWSRWMRRLSWVLVVGTFLGAVMVVWLPALADGRGLDESVAFRVATRSMAAAVAAAVLVCLFWQLISLKEPSASSASPNVPAAG